MSCVPFPFVDSDWLHVCMYQCMPVTGWPYPKTIERVPAYAGEDGAGSDHGKSVKEPTVPAQRTDGMSAHTRSRVTALGRITRVL
jgi:hypothetical protein